jgi:hypothetical protein
VAEKRVPFRCEVIFGMEQESFEALTTGNVRSLMVSLLGDRKHRHRSASCPVRAGFRIRGAAGVRHEAAGLSMTATKQLRSLNEFSEISRYSATLVFRSPKQSPIHV